MIPYNPVCPFCGDANYEPHDICELDLTDPNHPDTCVGAVVGVCERVGEVDVWEAVVEDGAMGSVMLVIMGRRCFEHAAGTDMSEGVADVG